MKVTKVKNYGMGVNGLGEKVFRTGFFLEDGTERFSDCPASIRFAVNPALERMKYDRAFCESIGISHAEFDDTLGAVMAKNREKELNGGLFNGLGFQN